MTDDDDNTFAARTGRLAIPTLCCMAGLAIMLTGMAAGAIAYVRGDIVSTSLLLSGAAFVIGTGILIATFRKWPTLRQGEPDTPRNRRLSVAMIALVLFSVVVSIFFIQPNGDSISSELYSNGPLPAHLALGAAGLWLLGMPLLTWLTRKNLDEVERGHMMIGESVGVQFLTVAAPVWWLGFRGGMLPQPDAMILFVAVLVVASIANMLRRAA